MTCTCSCGGASDDVACLDICVELLGSPAALTVRELLRQMATVEDTLRRLRAGTLDECGCDAGQVPGTHLLDRKRQLVHEFRHRERLTRAAPSTTRSRVRWSPEGRFGSRLRRARR